MIFQKKVWIKGLGMQAAACFKQTQSSIFMSKVDLSCWNTQNIKAHTSATAGKEHCLIHSNSWKVVWTEATTQSTERRVLVSTTEHRYSSNTWYLMRLFQFYHVVMISSLPTQVWAWSQTEISVLFQHCPKCRDTGLTTYIPRRTDCIVLRDGDTANTLSCYKPAAGVKGSKSSQLSVMRQEAPCTAFTWQAHPRSLQLVFTALEATFRTRGSGVKNLSTSAPWFNEQGNPSKPHLTYSPWLSHSCHKEDKEIQSGVCSGDPLTLPQASSLPPKPHPKSKTITLQTEVPHLTAYLQGKSPLLQRLILLLQYTHLGDRICQRQHRSDCQNTFHTWFALQVTWN